jgi:hypothetical protein
MDLQSPLREMHLEKLREMHLGGYTAGGFWAVRTSWDILGHPGASWGILGASWAIPGHLVHSLPVLDDVIYLGHPGTSWDILGHLGPSSDMDILGHPLE